jgi:hypothetical protein
MKRRSWLILIAGLILISACQTAPRQTPQAVPLFIGDTKDPRYGTMWDSARSVISKYFDIHRADRRKGFIVSEPRTDKDAEGEDTKRAFVSIKQLADGYDVKVEVPYLTYERYENVYGEAVKDGKTTLVVERKKLEPPSKSDIYLEALIRNEILRKAK